MADKAESTETLVAAAQEGDRAALDRLCERYRPQLLRMVRWRLDGRLRSRIDESDIVQETLTVASRDLPQYRVQEGAKFYAWLRQIAWRQLLRADVRHIATAKRTVTREDRLDSGLSHGAVAEVLASYSTPSAGAAKREVAARIETALETLSTAEREAVLLRFVEQLTTQEAAAVQGVSTVTYRARLARALEALGTLLKDSLGS